MLMVGLNYTDDANGFLSMCIHKAISINTIFFYFLYFLSSTAHGYHALDHKLDQGMIQGHYIYFSYECAGHTTKFIYMGAQF